jgi:hypothetical protein
VTDRQVRVLVLHVATQENRTLSYQHGWPGALDADPRFDCTVVNLASAAARAALLVRARTRTLHVDAVAVLHGVFSNEDFLRGSLLDGVAALDAAKVFFVGNEYKLMPEKVAFAERLGVDLLVSQLSSPAAHELYRARLGCAVIGLPNTGLDPTRFAPRTPWRERMVDVGYRAYANPAYLGHRERHELAERALAAGSTLGLVLDVSLDPADRLDGDNWPAFLDRCKAQLGTAAGGDRFELTDATRHAVNAFVAERPDAPFAELRTRFFSSSTGAVSGRALSSRVIEAAGTKTTQLLLHDDYGGYFRPWEHYIPIAKDFSDLDAALAAVRDEALCTGVADAAYEVALTELTWPPLLDRLYAALEPLL